MCQQASHAQPEHTHPCPSCSPPRALTRRSPFVLRPQAFLEDGHLEGMGKSKQGLLQTQPMLMGFSFLLSLPFGGGRGGGRQRGGGRGNIVRDARLKAISFLTTCSHSYPAGQPGLSIGPRSLSTKHAGIHLPVFTGAFPRVLLCQLHAKGTGLHN